MVVAPGGTGMYAFLFIPAMILCILFSALLLVYSAHYYFLTFQQTAAGIDEIRWGDEALSDRLFLAALVVGLLAICLVPVGMAARGLENHWLLGKGHLRFLALAAPTLWLIFPLEMLLSAAFLSSSPPIGPMLINRLGTFLLNLMGFYLLTALPATLSALLVYFSLFTSAWYLVPLTAAVISAGIMIHARLLGRLAWLATRAKQTRPRSSRKHKMEKAETSCPQPEITRRGLDQRAISDQSVDCHDQGKPTPKTTRGTEKKKPSRPAYLDPEPEPYHLKSDEGFSPAARGSSLSNPAEEQMQRELALRLRNPPNKDPHYPLLSGVFSFPFYPNSLGGLILLMGLSMGGMGFFRLMVSFFPFE